MAVISYVYKVDGTPTDVDSIKLSSPDETYGVRRTDTDAVVVADGTDMDRLSAGTYEYDLGTISVEHEYYIEVIEDDSNPAVVDYVHGFKQPDSAGGVSESTLSLTRTDLRRAVARYKGISRDPNNWRPQTIQDLDDIVQAGERMFYQPGVLPNEQSIHTWTFLNPIGEFPIHGSYAEGTVSVTDGVVTLSDGTWPSWAADGVLFIEGIGYEVDSRDDGTEITLVNTSVDASSGTSYSLDHLYYDLPSDYSSFLEPKLHFREEDDSWHSVTQVGVSRILKERQDRGNLVRVTTTYPRLFAVTPLASEGTMGQRFRLLWDTAPTADGTLTGPYKSNPFAMSASAPYPLGGQPHAETLRAAVLAAAEMDKFGARGDLYARFQELLRDSVALDRKQNGTKFFGYNGNGDSCRDDYPWTRRRGVELTFPDW